MVNLSFLDPFVFRVPVGVLSRVRVLFFRLLGARIARRNRLDRTRARRLSQIEIGRDNAFDRDCCLWPSDSAHDGIRIRIGDRNYFNRDVMIDAAGLVEIGDDNAFGPGVYITDSSHHTERGVPPLSGPMRRGAVKIGDRCWIGTRAIVLENVEIGDDTVVGAGSVVNKSFPPGSVIAGVPARLIREAGGS